MKIATTLFLKIAVILIGILVLTLCIFLVPELADCGSGFLRYSFHKIYHFHPFIWRNITFLLRPLSSC